ncbi:AAA family ATPase [Ramlibacter sp. AN1015]|uniref:AAA family ATPase n=1 Tax=Ramlibacter sp. AN1015 TaxID=3133428 RepID=UPI0030BF4055
MNISIISPNPQHLAELETRLKAVGHQVTSSAGGKSRLVEVVQQQHPDIVLVDGMCCDVSELQQVEQVTNAHPQTAVLLLCATHTPEFLIGAMRAGVREVLPSPPAAPALYAAVERITARRQGPAAQLQQGRVLSFMAPKGGAGATFVASNLGWSLTERHSVLLIDLNLQFGDALSFVHDSKPTSTVAEVARDITRLDATLLASSVTRVSPRFSILAAPDDMGQAVEIQPEHVDKLLALATTQYDFVLLDLPRSLDPVIVRALDATERIYLVLQSALPDVRHASRLLEAFRGLGYADEKSELILNRHERSSEIGVDHVQRSLGRLKVHTIPNSFRDVRASINQGEPLAKTARSHQIARQIAQFAQTVQPRQERAKGLFGRFFKAA